MLITELLIIIVFFGGLLGLIYLAIRWKLKKKVVINGKVKAIVIALVITAIVFLIITDKIYRYRKLSISDLGAILVALVSIAYAIKEVTKKEV